MLRGPRGAPVPSGEGGGGLRERDRDRETFKLTYPAGLQWMHKGLPARSVRESMRTHAESDMGLWPQPMRDSPPDT